MNSIRITILFEDPFWVGFLERINSEGYFVAKAIFGSEPTNNDVYDFLLNNMDCLRFGNPMVEETKKIRVINPKRKQREAQKELQNKALLSKAHEAMKLVQEQNKNLKKQDLKVKKEKLVQERYRLKQQKKKQKLRGR